jgi:hypothetical protein
MKSLTPAIVRRHEERGYYAPVPVPSREAAGLAAHALIPIPDTGGKHVFDDQPSTSDQQDR